MPIFNWLGVNEDGLVVRGQLFSSSINEVAHKLKQKKIDLVNVSEKRSFFGWLSSVSLKDKVDFFVQLNQLLASGIMLPKALAILEKSNVKMYAAIGELNLQVQEGASFAEALRQQPKVFDSLEAHLAMAGQEAGNLAGALKYVAEFLEVRQKFKAKLKSLLLLPAITFLFFIAISLVIFFYVIPSFSSIFQDNSIAQTGLVFKLSAWFNQIGFYRLMLIVFGVGAAAYLFLKTSLGRHLKSYLALRLPFVKNITLAINLTYLLESLAFMLKAGVHLSTALEISQNSVANLYLKKELSNLSNLVKKGQSLEDAMESLGIFPLDVLAMVSVGQESGRLGFMMQKAADVYLEKSLKLISSFLNVFQPMLMLILGLLVMTLIFSVYLPIFDLASGIQI